MHVQPASPPSIVSSATLCKKPFFFPCAPGFTPRLMAGGWVLAVRTWLGCDTAVVVATCSRALPRSRAETHGYLPRSSREKARGLLLAFLGLMTQLGRSNMKLSTIYLALGLVLSAACGGQQTKEKQSHQVVGSDGAFETVLLTSSGGMPPPQNAGDQCGSQYVNTVQVDATATMVTWDACHYDSSSGHTVINQGTRTLTPDELATVRAALLQVRIGNSGMCGADKATVTIDVQVNGSVGRYVDDFYGCNPAPDGRTFVENIDVMESAMGKLVD